MSCDLVTEKMAETDVNRMLNFLKSFEILNIRQQKALIGFASKHQVRGLILLVDALTHGGSGVWPVTSKVARQIRRKRRAFRDLVGPKRLHTTPARYQITELLSIINNLFLCFLQYCEGDQLSLLTEMASSGSQESNACDTDPLAKLFERISTASHVFFTKPAKRVHQRGTEVLSHAQQSPLQHAGQSKHVSDYSGTSSQTED